MIKNLVMFVSIAVLLAGANVQAQEPELYELRTYTTHEGKLEALHARFRNHTQTLFENHGMRNIGYWVPTDTPNTLVYLIAHESAEAAKISWENFVADPQWQTVYKTSIIDGPLVSKIDSSFMSATDYSPMR